MENARGNDMFRGKLLSTIKAYKYNVVHGRSFQKDPPPRPFMEEEWRMVYRYFFVHLFDYDYIYFYIRN